MYDYYEKSTSILLWCCTEAGTQTAKKKGSVSTSKSSKSGTKYWHLEDRAAVDDIHKELQEEHTSYSPTRQRAWDNMVNMKTWASLDEPPNKPFFTRGRKRSSKDNASTDPCHQEAIRSKPKKLWQNTMSDGSRRVSTRKLPWQTISFSTSSASPNR